jgi:crotonobetainyl-CoA:carnitine CoA-transferase CaiB-like acyl-CoA transferase
MTTPRGLDDLVVVEFAGSVAGANTAKLLGDLGARVVCLEPPTGAPLRADAAQWAAFATSRRCLAASSPEAVEWLALADVVIESDARYSVGADAHAVPASAIHVVISPFGSTGPYARWQSCDIVDQAIGGHLYLSGTPDREPLQGPTGQAALAAGIWAAIGTLSALMIRKTNGVGQRVEVTHHEALAALHQFTDVRWTHARNVLKRMGNRYAGPGSPIGMYRASDGWVAFTVATAAHGEMLLAMTGLTHLLDLPGVESVTDIMTNPAILDPALNGWLATQTVEEAVNLLQSARLAVGPVLTMRQVLDDPHLAARDWWHHVTIDGIDIRLPGPPYRIGNVSWTSTPALPAVGPPPAESIGGSAAHWQSRRAADLPTDCASSANAPTSHGNARPLDGVRVLDLTRVWAGPLAARILSDLGAEVVMVEALWQRSTRVAPQSYVDATHFYPNDDPLGEPWNTHGFVNKFALGKKALGLDLSTDAGQRVFERLVASADVLIENFSPRVMPNLGFHEDRLHEINPHLVYLTMPGYGRTGPASEYSAYGPVLDSHAGLSTLMGYADVDAWKCGIAWPDPIGGVHGALSVLAALWNRTRDPQRQGTTIELAQLETAITMIGDRLVRAQLDGQDPPIIGNRHPVWAPQGVYRTSGEDRWLALSAPDDATWHALCATANLPNEWTSWALLTRRERHDQIDIEITHWTHTQTNHHAAALLQAAGVPAAPVADAQDLMEDPHLAERAFFTELTHPVAGTHAWHGLACRLSTTPAAVRSAAPCLGQHNREILINWAGCTDGDVDALLANNVIGTEPPA